MFCIFCFRSVSRLIFKVIGRQRGRVVKTLGLHAAAPGSNPVITSG